jgi:type II secretory pathway predicted ATPase ExeA
MPPVVGDADRLANLHYEKVKNTKLLLLAHDSLETRERLIEIEELNARFIQFEKQCLEKYSDSAERNEFNIAYQNALSEKK